MNYYIADCHFGDERVIDFCHRPFETVEEMDEFMISSWNRTVREWDDVYIIGDLMHRVAEPEQYLIRLKGRLHLICGNHDGIIRENPCLHTYFEEIADYLVIQDGRHRLDLFHYPLLEWDGYYYGTWHLYGHIHNHPSLTQERVRMLPKALNCGVDVIGYRPLCFDELVTANKRDCERSMRPQGSV
ncbi:MAG: hypothetical protein SOW48_00760 [Peptoniphilaceae bacterium]|nr:hypothetical protein [Peptoniphilaceae bacterium]MCI6659822.1 hypothetical protein [Peptoniphilaceae bacterium]MDD7433873.1 hypothetical protein [Peptoniphilaceae bacterium]MDD7542951.1 hypothetical protein [Peptoniphilaceae bacterium]MDY3075182.1 hypothetical protein [Peptoniphilaceae bacterium]